jgi:hypothetical protein
VKDLVRFINTIKVVNECWEWQNKLDIDGYGIFRHKNKNVRAHRFSYGYFNQIDKLDRNMHVDHLCRNRSCVRPDHLELVTPRENTLRGLDAKAAINARKTHCINGHKYTEENTYYHIRKTPKRNNGKLSGRKERQCRECQRERKRKRFLAARKARVDAGETITMGPKPKEFCKYGHSKTGDNLYITPAGVRNCKECNRVKSASYRDRIKQTNKDLQIDP